MKNFLFQTRINYKRIIFRNLRFLLFNTMMPIGFYLLFTQVMRKGMSPKIVTTWNIDYLVSMIVYSALISGVFTVANTLLDDHTRQFDLFIRLTPLPKVQYYLSMIVCFLTLITFSTLALEFTAVLVNHVDLALIYLIGLPILIPIVALPLLFIGILVSWTGSGNVVNLLSNLIVFPTALVSGLWWPLETMPESIQKIGKWLPPYRISKLAQSFIHQQPIKFTDFGVLLLWVLFLSVMLKGGTVLKTKSEAQTI